MPQKNIKTFMSFGFYLWNSDRKTSIKLTWFIIIILIISVVLGVIFNTSKTSQSEKRQDQTTEAPKDV